MNLTFLKNITLEKALIYILIAAAIITFGFIIFLFVQHFSKGVTLTSPLGGEEWGISQTYSITWKSRGIDRVGIVLFKGEEPQWIAQNVLAGQGRYDWEIFPGQPYGGDYWVAVFEYPWKKGNKISYSKSAFTVVFPELFSCDDLSVQNEWPFVPSDLPNLRRTFVTSPSFMGNLDGLQGADKKCQAEADSQKLGGQWQAFIGGDGDQESAMQRLKAAPRKTDGLFVVANPSATLLRGATCHRLLGKTLNEFLSKLSDSAAVNADKFDRDFFSGLGSIWVGRIDESSVRNCASIQSVINDPYTPLPIKYSFTTTCQNWTQSGSTVAGYPVPAGTSKPPFPTCYTEQGRLTDAVAVGGLAGILVGSSSENSFIRFTSGAFCNLPRKLLCVEK